MAPVPDVQAHALPTGARIGVLRFDRDHERMGLGPHRHKDLALMYFDGAGGRHRIALRTHTPSPGDVLLLTPGLVHDATALRGTSGWAVEFDPLALGLTQAPAAGSGPSLTLPRAWWANPLLAPFLRAEQHPTAAVFSVPEHERPLWATHLRIMHREHMERRDGYEEMVGAYLTIILVALSRLTAHYPDTLERAGDPALAQVFRLIEQHYTGSLSTSDIAAGVGMTPGHLTTLVRRRTGRTIGEWITERRMAAARDLLVSTDLSAEQVAARVGYADPGYFNRKFRQVHGTPPGAWRARALGI
jgi:AraC family transcriptional regulator, transcriptional activator of pobA